MVGFALRPARQRKDLLAVAYSFLTIFRLSLQELSLNLKVNLARHCDIFIWYSFSYIGCLCGMLRDVIGSLSARVEIVRQANVVWYWRKFVLNLVFIARTPL